MYHTDTYLYQATDTALGGGFRTDETLWNNHDSWYPKISIFMAIKIIKLSSTPDPKNIWFKFGGISLLFFLKKQESICEVMWELGGKRRAPGCWLVWRPSFPVWELTDC